MEPKMVWSLVAIGVFLIIANFGKVKTLFSKLPGVGSPASKLAAPETPTRADAFIATETLVDYYDMTGCPVGAKAARDLALHLFHEKKEEVVVS